MARPTKLTPELMTGIVTLIQHAVHPTVAAASFGVASSTFFEWIARGEGRSERGMGDPLYMEFADAVRAAEDQAESALVQLAITKAKTSADAIAILERRFRDRWKRTDEVSVNIRLLAEKLAGEGLDPKEVIAEAERILSEA
jgi:class 3 adenylate cyclase